MNNIYDKFGYSIVLSPIVISYDFFNEWKNASQTELSYGLPGVEKDCFTFLLFRYCRKANEVYCTP